MKNKVILYYRRPSKIEPNAEQKNKNYTLFNSPLDTAMDNALRLALAGYAVQLTLNDKIIINWKENFIARNYKTTPEKQKIANAICCQTFGLDII